MKQIILDPELTTIPVSKVESYRNVVIKTPDGAAGVLIFSNTNCYIQYSNGVKSVAHDTLQNLMKSMPHHTFYQL